MKSEYLYVGAVASIILFHDLGNLLGIQTAFTAMPVAALLGLAGCTKSSFQIAFIYGLTFVLLESRLTAQQFLSKRLKE